MDDVVVLEWTFSPSDYFEEEIVIERDTYTMTIGHGTVEAWVDPAAYDQEHKMRSYLHNMLNDYFLGVQLSTHGVYTLSQASMYKPLANGRKEHTIFLESIVSSSSVSAVDLVVKDKDGNIISDSRKERIDKVRRLSELIAKHRPKDKVLNSVLISHQTALEDPHNELVHLYEIRDALSDKFGGENNARAELTVTKAKWSRLGKLANDEPLRQGRHRGRKVRELRDATKSELAEARSIARTMIEAYLEYLEK